MGSLCPSSSEIISDGFFSITLANVLEEHVTDVHIFYYVDLNGDDACSYDDSDQPFTIRSVENPGMDLEIERSLSDSMSDWAPDSCTAW